jgi:hypothetical protein
MDLKSVGAIGRQLRPLEYIALPIIVCVLISLAGCHPAETQVQNEPQHVPEAPPKRKIEPKFPACPGKIATGPKNHTVTLTWNRSVTPNNKEVRYCLYRSRGRVQRIKGELTVDKPPCSNCELVTATPVPATNATDVQIDNESSYCYVAVAIEDGGNKFSEFSNQAQADVPKADVPGSNQPSSGTLCDTNKASKHR